jgi:vitamin-K-epoxide reductase (warfarin-sensitive)
MVLNDVKIIALIGFLISWYAYHVKISLGLKNYKPWCDVAENISCSKAFSNKYSELFLLPNAVLGMLLYFLTYIFALFNKIEIIFFLALLASMISLYLAFISYVKQRNFCLVCSASYLVSFLLLFVAYLKIYG